MAYKRILMLVGVTSAAALLFSSCNTVRGVGKDLEKGGTKIQEMADR